MTRFYRFYHYLAQVLIWLFTRRCVVHGVHHVPRRGPAILISNHLSYSDPATIIGTLPRQVYFMTKAEMFNGGFMHWVIAKADAFPVQRGSLDLKALRQARRILERGDLLGIYPEGRRSHNRQLQAAHAGVVMVAQQTGAPLIPVAITGMEQVFTHSFPWCHWPQISIRYGQPFYLRDLYGPGETLQRDELARRMMERLAHMLPEAYGGYFQTHAG